ncbi:uncharacterized protein LOC135500094 [Lineus longissimus]|uniref:uncharacterized protein LOC135500094 n=1 Tax=Lineus longissimus TaxID=88925 RepID=UPI002B4C6935
MAVRGKHFCEVLLLFFTVFLAICIAEECKKDATSWCKCTTSKGVIDLAPLASKSGAKFKDVPVKGKTNLYSINLCEPFSEVDSKGVGCDNVLGCQVIPAQPGGSFSYHPIGAKKIPWVVAGTVEDGNLQFQYSADSDTLRKMFITLVCANEEGSLVAYGETATTVYTFKLSTRYACYNGVYPYQGISTGSVLLIVFFVLILVYLVGGFLFLTYARGATGMERVPNFEFWADFPHLIKEGAMFVFRGCKTESTYDQI